MAPRGRHGRRYALHDLGRDHRHCQQILLCRRTTTSIDQKRAISEHSAYRPHRPDGQNGR